MIIYNKKKYIEANFNDESEIEELVLNNSEHFFGPSSIMIPKKLIKTGDGIGTIPDGFAVDIGSRIWYVVEAELGCHQLWDHIAPQVTKQLLAANCIETRELITEIIIELISEDDSVKEKFEDEGIKEIDIRKVIEEILVKPPIVGMPIDSVSNDLKGWAETLRNDVRLWSVKKYIQFGDPSDIAYIIPEEYRPVLDTTERDKKGKSGITTYDVTMKDLMDYGLLSMDQVLYFSYRPRGGAQKIFNGMLKDNGVLVVLNEEFNTPSYAALYCIQSVGSERTTVNGWTKWKTSNGNTLAMLRDKYLNEKESDIEPT